MTARLEVVGLTAGYGPAPVLLDVTIEVRPAEIIGLFGANGAGKTTLLRGVSGTLPVCRGEIRIDGHNIEGASPWRRVRSGVAHVPEGRHVFPAMTVRENLEVAGLVRRRAVRVDDEVFALFPQLADRRNQHAGDLSGGEQQMLAIGQALMAAPQILLIDEMSAGLAPIIVRQLVQALAALREGGTSVLLVEQSPHLVAAVIDRVYLLDQGRIVGAGTLDELGGVDRLAEMYLGVS